MNYRLLAVDLDGTLLDSSEKISDRNISAIRSAFLKGLKVVVTTGRSYTTAESHIHALNAGNLSVTYNGALIRNGKSIMRVVPLDREIAKQVLAALFELGHSPIVYSSDECKYYEEADRRTRDFISYVAGPEKRMIQVKNLAEHPWQNALRLSVITGAAQVPVLHGEIARRFSPRIRTIDTYFPEFDFWTFEILDVGCSKSKGLQHLCAIYGIDREEVIAVGDNDNDIDMILWAGLGAAMRNGLPAVLKAADYVTSRTNDEDGVAEVIERFICPSGMPDTFCPARPPS